MNKIIKIDAESWKRIVVRCYGMGYKEVVGAVPNNELFDGNFNEVETGKWGNQTSSHFSDLLWDCEQLNVDGALQRINEQHQKCEEAWERKHGFSRESEETLPWEYGFLIGFRFMRIETLRCRGRELFRKEMPISDFFWTLPFKEITRAMASNILKKFKRVERKTEKMIKDKDRDERMKGSGRFGIGRGSVGIIDRHAQNEINDMKLGLDFECSYSLPINRGKNKDKNVLQIIMDHPDNPGRLSGFIVKSEGMQMIGEVYE